MIIKGRARQDGKALAAYLLKETDRQQARVIDLRDSATQDLGEALTDWEATANALTKGKKPLYHVQIRLPEGETLTREQWLTTVEKLEKRLKMEGCPRAIVGHKLDGELHLHVAWSRLDLDREKLVHLSNDRQAHHAVAREAERDYNLRQLNQENGQTRDKRGTAKQRDAEYKQAARTDTSRGFMQKNVTAAFMASKSPADFEANLLRLGLHLHKGGRRDYVIARYGVRGEPEIFSPVRLIPGMTAEKFRQKMNGHTAVLAPMTDRERRFREQAAKDALKPKRPPRRQGGRRRQPPQPQLKPPLHYGVPGI